MLLRLAGAGLIALALVHLPIARRLRWCEEATRMSPVNAAIFHVHAFFICLMLVMIGLPCLVEPGVFLESSRAARWIAWSFSGFWTVRLYCQWFVYRPELWRGKRLETFLHAALTIVWAALAGLFAACGIYQLS